MKKEILIALAIVAVISSGGCGSGGGVTGLFKKNNTAEEKQRKVKSRNKDLEKMLDKQLSGSMRKEAEDSTFVKGSLSEQLRSLEKRLSDENSKLAEYSEKKSEYSQREAEYRNRIATTRKKIEVVQKIINAIENDPSALTRELDAKASEEKVFSGGPGNWKESTTSTSNQIPGVTGSDNAPSALLPEEISDSFGQDAQGSLVKGPPTDDNAFVPSAPIGSPAMNNSLPPAIRNVQNQKSATILASEGNGAGTVAIIGAGTAEGIRKGMCFETSDGAGGKTLLVVTDVYSTCSRAIPHPKSQSYQVKVNQKAYETMPLQ